MALGEGPNRAVHGLVRRWQESGNEVTVMTGSPETAETPGVRTRFSLLNRFLFPLLRSYVWLPRSRTEMEEYDAILDVGRTLTLHLYQRIFGGRPAFVQFHQIMYLADRVNRRNFVSRIRSFALEYLTISLARKLIVVGEAHKKWMVALYGNEEKFAVIPNGVSLSEFKRSRKTRSNSILFVGNLSVHFDSKGVPTLLKAFSAFAKTSKDCTLIFAGKPNQRLDAMCRELGITDRVRYLGVLDKAKLVEQYNTARALVLPSIMDSDGLVVKEAMACGLPVIVSDGVGSSDVVLAANAGMTFPVNDHLSLRSCLDAIVNDETLASELGNNGRLYAEANLAWDKVAEDYLNLFKAGQKASPEPHLALLVSPIASQGVPKTTR